MTVQRILRREETAGRKGCDWLATIPPDQLSAEQHIQRLFALGAFSAAHLRAFRLANIDLRRLAGALPEFVWHRCPGDPFFAVAASRLLARHPVGLETFDELRKGLRAVLFGEEQDGTATPLWADLLLEKGKSYLPTNRRRTYPSSERFWTAIAKSSLKPAEFSCTPPPAAQFPLQPRPLTADSRCSACPTHEALTYKWSAGYSEAAPTSASPRRSSARGPASGYFTSSSRTADSACWKWKPRAPERA